MRMSYLPTRYEKWPVIPPYPRQLGERWRNDWKMHWKLYRVVISIVFAVSSPETRSETPVPYRLGSLRQEDFELKWKELPEFGTVKQIR